MRRIGILTFAFLFCFILTASPRRLRREMRFVEEQNALRKGMRARSLRHFVRAIHEFPDYYEAYSNKGAAELLLNQKDEALQSFQKAIDLSGGHYTPRVLRLWSCVA